jgi:hypothetical protein
VPGAVGEVDDLQRRFDMRAALLRVELGQQQRQLDILRGRQHRHQVVELEDEADIGRAPARQLTLAQALDVLAGELDLAGAGRVDAAEQVQQRRLARAGRTHDGDEVAMRDRHAEMIEYGDRLAPLGEALGNVGEFDQRFARHRL